MDVALVVGVAGLIVALVALALAAKQVKVGRRQLRMAEQQVLFERLVQLRKLTTDFEFAASRCLESIDEAISALESLKLPRDLISPYYLFQMPKKRQDCFSRVEEVKRIACALQDAEADCERQLAVTAALVRLFNGIFSSAGPLAGWSFKRYMNEVLDVSHLRTHLDEVTAFAKEKLDS